MAKARRVLRPPAMRKTFSIALVAMTANHAAAEVDRCATADADLAWRANDLAEIAGDTGWFPSGFVAQLRISGRVVGHTAVDAGVRTTACWSNGMQASVDGRPGSGWLDVAYGAELRLRGRIHTTVLGKTINWEGDIALPDYLPTLLVLEGQTSFDPRIGGTQVARVSDSTQPITVLATNALDGIIDVIGITGGLRVTATPIMSTSYRTRTAELDGNVVGAAGEQVEITRDGGYAEALDLAVAADGLVRYEPRIRFDASLDLRIFGYQVVDWDIGSVSMNLPAIERPIRLTGDAARLALPQLDGVGEGARIDFATGPSQELRVLNRGEAPLAIEATSAPAGVTVEPLVIAPGDEATLRVTVANDDNFDAQLVLATNDPDQPELAIRIGKDVGGTDPGEVGDDPPTESGCSTGGGAGPGILLLVALALRGRRASKP